MAFSTFCAVGSVGACRPTTCRLGAQSIAAADAFSGDFEVAKSWHKSLNSREMLRVACNQPLEAQGERFDEHVGNWTLPSVSRPLVRDVISPKFVSRLSVLPVPRFQPIDANLPQERPLQRVFASKSGCQFDIGHRAKDQAVW